MVRNESNGHKLVAIKNNINNYKQYQNKKKSYSDRQETTTKIRKKKRKNDL